MTTESRGTTSAANKEPVSPARADCYDRQCRYKPSVPERRGGPERCHLRPAPLDNRLTLGASADKKLLCEPSQGDALPVCLHWQKYTVFVSSAVQAIGVMDVPLCGPLQNG